MYSSASQAHPCFPAHFNTARCPPARAALQVSPSHGQPCSPRPPQHDQVASYCCCVAGVFVPGASMLPRPPQNCQMSSFSGRKASRSIPGAALLPRSPRHVQVASFSVNAQHVFLGHPCDHVAPPSAGPPYGFLQLRRCMFLCFSGSHAPGPTAALQGGVSSYISQKYIPGGSRDTALPTRAPAVALLQPHRPKVLSPGGKAPGACCALPCRIIHCTIASCPALAALAHVSDSAQSPPRRPRCITLRSPPSTAAACTPLCRQPGRAPGRPTTPSARRGSITAPPLPPSVAAASSTLSRAVRHTARRAPRHVAPSAPPSPRRHRVPLLRRQLGAVADDRHVDCRNWRSTQPGTLTTTQ